MKKRTVHIIIAVTCLLFLIALELYLRAEYNLQGATSPLGAMLEQAAPWIIIAVIGVAAHDVINIRNRKETPLDAVMVKGFRVQEKKCTYGEEHTAILCLANCAKNTYTVTVTVTYLNVAGRVLGQETQTVIGFARGMEKYLCFRPGRDFHSFSYTLETALFRGIGVEKDFRLESFGVVPLHGGEDPEMPQQGIYPVQLHVTEEYVGTREVEVSCAYILLDKENTVHGICTPPPRRLTEPVPAHTFPAAEFSYLSKGEIPLDEELPKEGVKGICVYTVTPV
jgi:hypothetical protein